MRIIAVFSSIIEDYDDESDKNGGPDNESDKIGGSEGG